MLGPQNETQQIDLGLGVLLSQKMILDRTSGDK